MAIPVIVSVETRAMQTGTIPERSWQATCTRNKKRFVKERNREARFGVSCVKWAVFSFMTYVLNERATLLLSS